MASPLSPVLSPNSAVPSGLHSPVLLPHSPRELRLLSPRPSVSGTGSSATTGLTRRNSGAKLLPSTSSISLLSLSFANASMGSEDISPNVSPQATTTPSRSGSFSNPRNMPSPSSSPHVNPAFHNRISHYHRSLRSSSTSYYQPSQLASIPNSPELGPVSLGSSPTKMALASSTSSNSLSNMNVTWPISIPGLQGPTLSPVGTPTGEPMTPMELESDMDLR